MKITSRLRQTAALLAGAAVFAASLAAQVAPTLSTKSDIQARAIVLRLQVQGAPNSPVLVAASFRSPLGRPILTPMGNLLIGSVDAVLSLYTDARGSAQLRVALPRPVPPFFFWMQALAGGKLTNAVAIGAGGGIRAATVEIAGNDKGELTSMTIRAEGKPKDEVCITFKDKNGREVPPKICGTIGGDGKLPGGTMTVPIHKDAKTFEVTVGGERKARGVIR